MRSVLAGLKDVENMLIARLSPDGTDTQFALPRGEALDLGEEITIRANPEGGWKTVLEKFGAQSSPSYHQHLAGLATSDEEGESSGDDLAYTSSGSGTMQMSDSAFRTGKAQKGKLFFFRRLFPMQWR